MFSHESRFELMMFTRILGLNNALFASVTLTAKALAQLGVSEKKKKKKLPQDTGISNEGTDIANGKNVIIKE